MLKFIDLSLNHMFVPRQHGVWKLSVVKHKVPFRPITLGRVIEEIHRYKGDTDWYCIWSNRSTWPRVLDLVSCGYLWSYLLIVNLDIISVIIGHLIICRGLLDDDNSVDCLIQLSGLFFNLIHLYMVYFQLILDVFNLFSRYYFFFWVDWFSNWH